MDALTDTHKTLLSLYADGYNRKRAAQQLSLTVVDVKRLTREACRILNAKNRTHAVAVAWRARLIV